MNQVDARGYSCPEPVLMTKNALKNGTPLVVLVDNETPLQNVRRFAANNGYQVSWKEVGEDYEITITK
ncbi:sulfurtransferase TusA family protein [uncultured Flavonifractor sp.]|uniref:sulfurtransferase TusA family protein n=1 Tax=uncultured Flavonifractor sp. TaxID=1193534 RepID=UPI002607FA18|nr:sulfurtransferase TusA family protein [uncultured Flavonifractor sp.]